MKKLRLLAIIILTILPIISFSEETINLNSSDLFERIGLSPTASEKEIKKQIKKLSLKYHPDRNGNDEDIKKITEAKSILLPHSKNIVIREIYDKYGIAAARDAQAKITSGYNVTTAQYSGYSSGNQGQKSTNNDNPKWYENRSGNFASERDFFHSLGASEWLEKNNLPDNNITRHFVRLYRQAKIEPTIENIKLIYDFPSIEHAYLWSKALGEGGIDIDPSLINHFQNLKHKEQFDALNKLVFRKKLDLKKVEVIASYTTPDDLKLLTKIQELGNEAFQIPLYEIVKMTKPGTPMESLFLLNTNNQSGRKYNHLSHELLKTANNYTDENHLNILKNLNSRFEIYDLHEAGILDEVTKLEKSLPYVENVLSQVINTESLDSKIVKKYIQHVENGYQVKLIEELLERQIPPENLLKLGNLVAFKDLTSEEKLTNVLKKLDSGQKLSSAMNEKFIIPRTLKAAKLTCDLKSVLKGMLNKK